MPSDLAAVKGWVLAMLGSACAWLRFPAGRLWPPLARWPAWGQIGSEEHRACWSLQGTL